MLKYKIKKGVEWICTQDGNGIRNPILYQFKNATILFSNISFPSNAIAAREFIIEFISDIDPFEEISKTLGLKNACVCNHLDDGRYVLRCTMAKFCYNFNFVAKTSVKQAIEPWNSSLIEAMVDKLDIEALNLKI